VLNPAQKLFIDAHHAHHLRLQRAQNGDDVESMHAGSTDKI
jgi:hypothetical protein